MGDKYVSTLVFDVDDTICVHTNRDYKNAVPKQEVVEKINDLYHKGHEIILYTSRGMVSCEGDINLIKSKNEETLIKWLNENDVKYHKIIFGKPIADMYIDDKCMNVMQFVDEDFAELKGGSGSKVYRLGNIVKKECKNADKVGMIKEWSCISKNMCLSPRVVSSLYNTIYLEYVSGKTLKDSKISKDDICEIMKVISRFKSKAYNTYNLDTQECILRLNMHYDDRIDKLIDVCIKLLERFKPFYERNGTFCHGDLTYSNIIKSKQNELYFIDYEYDERASSYLMDIAKLRMSALGYEKMFNLSKVEQDESILKYIDDCSEEFGGYDARVSSIVLTFMYILRLTRYNKENIEKVIDLVYKCMDYYYNDLSRWLD